MLQTTKCLLAPRCIPKLGPMRHIGALQKRTLGASTTRPKLPRVSVEMRAFHNSSKNSVACLCSSLFLSMPLSTLTTWPPRVLSAFRPRPCNSASSIFTVFLAVDNVWRPVMIMDVKDDSWFNRAELRSRADEQMYRHFDRSLAECPLPRLWGLSLLGTSLRVYRGDVATSNINPAFNRPSGRMPQDFLEGAWNIDIRSQEGFDKMKEIMADIFENAAALGSLAIHETSRSIGYLGD
ncbi:hypothetical protein BDZ89DRAFT_1074220 [Hymenopellis radicata]|nr:hypothetical protein BDZ89DRAFT_1074220 [Hymenopellis radicata]